MPLHRLPINDLDLEVADAAGGYKQKVHRAISHVPVGGTTEPISLLVYLTPYLRLPDGSYGERIPGDRIAVREVKLTATAATAVELSGRVRFRLLLPGLVRDVVQDTKVTLAGTSEQDWLDFLDALPDDLYLQHEAMAFKRDNEPVGLRAFAEQQIRAADLPPSSFA